MKINYKGILQNFKKKKKSQINIFDDILPSSLSPWRNYEFESISENFENTQIFSDLSTYQNYNQNKTYDENLKKLIKKYPNLKNNIQKLNLSKFPVGELSYTLFYNNIKKFLNQIEKNSNKFSFTLYPGGGFGLENKEIDIQLKKIFDSKKFKGVIVNQNITKKYLIEQQICNPKLINLIPGVPLKLDNPEIENFIYFKDIENTKVLFFANKYTMDGQDKGFDVFQKIVSILSNQTTKIQFIVIGGFSENDVVEKEAKNKIIFKGVLDEIAFEELLKQTHIIVSPNRPFILNKNAFDGFPLATCVTASFFGNLTLMTDFFNEAQQLNLNNEIDFIKINSNAIDISNTIFDLHNDKENLKKIALNGRKKLINLYSYENQIIPRINHFKQLLNN